MAEQSIDPRYDPAFQRGYAGAAATGSSTDAAPRRAAPHVVTALQRPSAADPVSRRPVEGLADLGFSPTAEVADADAVAAHPASADPQPQPQTVVHAPPPALRPPWTNPFAIVVAIVGVAVLGVGIWTLQEVMRIVDVSASGGPQSTNDYFVLQIGMIAAPIFVGLGVAILVAVLMLCAAYWARRPVEAAESV
ncbi:MAG: hypothetical protein DI534_04345 [Leifsonia xyli]|nr:MAG: hypothetical protein DI534_04345 [Leifsonia xyli]